MMFYFYDIDNEPKLNRILCKDTTTVSLYRSSQMNYNISSSTKYHIRFKFQKKITRTQWTNTYVREIYNQHKDLNETND